MYGGGLVEGDHVKLQVDIKEQCCALLTSQGFTKVQFYWPQGKIWLVKNIKAFVIIVFRKNNLENINFLGVCSLTWTSEALEKGE